jgi:hypothetical protein
MIRAIRSTRLASRRRAITTIAASKRRRTRVDRGGSDASLAEAYVPAETIVNL